VRLLRKIGGAQACVILAVVLAHAVILYEMTHAHSRATHDGPPMFREAIANKPVVEQTHPIRSRPWQPPVVDTSTYAVRNWRFPRIDIWPVTGEGCPIPSEFGPLMDTEPVADQAQAPPPRMVLWLRPAYPLEWARTEMEGTVRLGLGIHPTGDPYEIEIERSSGSQKLDAIAAGAAKSWRFAPAKWRGQPIESKATVELAFNFFEYRASHIDTEAITGISKKNAGGSARLDRSAVVRRLVEQLRTGTATAAFTAAYADGRPPWPAAMRDWGPVSGAKFLGTIGRPEWRRYNISPKFRVSGHANSVVVRWELYRVVHDSHAALWEVGLDRSGGVWALKAESLETSDRANESAPVCLAANRTKD
jgi:TonB family protein